jgi:hypothetical protein
MRLRNTFSITLVAALGLLAEAPAPVAGVTVVAGTGPDSVRVSGTFAGAHQLQAVLYATFAPDLPNVLLSRRALVTDAGGHFDVAIPLAPAYMTGAIITVIVQTSAAVPLGRGSYTITDPNDRTPASH